MSTDINSNQTTNNNVPVTQPNVDASSPAVDTDRNRDKAPVSREEAPKKESFAEVALRLGGASEEEAKRTGVLDTADDQVEDLFAAEYQTVNSPIHRAVWDRRVSTESFCPNPTLPSETVQRVTDRCMEITRMHRDRGTLFNEAGKITDEVMMDLADAGYWGLLVGTAYGGSGASMRDFARMITRMATVDPTVAGLASVHGCIGAVDPVRSFGNEEQKSRLLPGLADGTRLSAFALTEPGAGSDLTALKTTAYLDGDDYVVNGKKLFITNATYGRTIGLVCKIDDRPAVLIAELPAKETETFQIQSYGLYALSHAHNNALVFKDFRVPAANLLTPTRGDGLTIAYHGLNLGRVSLCANAAGAMRWMLTEMLPWAEFRKTYGQSIDQRELVRRRVGRMAGLIVACDALTHWCANLLDQGYRGEMECIIAKIFGSESQKEAAIELFMKTHGGRSFLHGHLFGDNVHDFLAPCIYEGEGEMLAMAFFKSLVKHHGKEYFEPIGHTLNELGVRQPSLINPMHLWALRRPMMRYGGWFTKKMLTRSSWSNVPKHSGVAAESLARHARFAQRMLSRSAMEISSTMRRHQLKLADRQCRMSALSTRVQNAVTVLVTALYAMEIKDPITRAAADTVCRELRGKITGHAPSDADYRQVTKLGAEIAAGGWSELAGIQAGPIMHRYQD